jgi:hypothetical protein
VAGGPFGSNLNTPVSYLELLTELSGEYGKLAESGCRAEDEIIAIQCTLRWEMKGVLIEALIRTAVPEGGLDAQTLLAVTATATRPDSAFIGLKEKKIRKKLPSLMPK